MASLPSKSFLVNYNARNFDGVKTIAKETGQLFDQDMVLNAAPSSYTSNSITLNGQFFLYSFSNASSNIFRRSGTQPLTIVAKHKKGLDTSGEHTIFSCRNNSALNYLLFNPANGCSNDIVFFHNSQRLYNNCPYVQFSSEPNIYAIRINGGSGFGYSYTDNQSFRSISNRYGSNNTNRIGFFTDSYSTSGFELWRGEFYWIYISTEALTDEEILQVIAYNEPAQFGIDPDEMTFGVTGGTQTVELTSSSSWSATSDNWITLSANSGTSGGSISVTAASNANNKQSRTGTVTFTDGSNSATLTISQDADNRLILKNLFANGNKVKQVFLNGNMIYRMMEYDNRN